MLHTRNKFLDLGFSPIELAQYELVHDYPGGAAALGPTVGMNPGTLNNKVNPSVETHRLAVPEAVALQHAAKDFRLLQVEAHVLGHSAVRLGDYSGVSDVEVLTAYCRFNAEMGEAAQAIEHALEDHKVTRRELDRIRTEGREMIQAWLELENRLMGLCDE